MYFTQPIDVLRLIDSNIESRELVMQLNKTRLCRSKIHLKDNGVYTVDNESSICDKIHHIIDMRYNKSITTSDICAYIGRDAASIYSMLQKIIREDIN